MASIRKRTWQSNAGAQSAWVLDYFDASHTRRLETFSSRKAAEARRLLLQNDDARWDHLRTLVKVLAAEPGADRRVVALAAAVAAIDALQS